MKDNFSNHAADYAKFRPTYPQELYVYLFDIVQQKSKAWDVATGNGQVAFELSKVFDEVLATDLSAKQLAEAPQLKNIIYRVQTAEERFDDNEQFDLITVAQAIHWFDFDAFYKQVKHHLKPDGIFAVIGYSVLETLGELNTVIQHFYKVITDPYWDPERKYLDENYKSIPFPFKEIEPPKLTMPIYWTVEELLNYLNTWSAVKHYEKANGKNPLRLIQDDVYKHWGAREKREFNFPLLLRVGKL
ncbi:class I SAM-dependent methyltransferase [Leeuwenhoekiella marinoflava]|uniref:Methyltransferase family protein n=2 Tax=Leeuwenhoekiella marinoflava TaxID=988 RepID=A0A4Q0PKJ5_9FLAO|nr:class I SAM-dependent methyltransferase [Leeuwenhoekiella marinoflava]RXG28483.1 methyltransferase family protein [Leeuwenhoekiella marinoflava]SHF52861.1 Methyltransferase domain-containing protein [Leeuwenhoekiella marinoflava DSM 3653]